MKSKKIISLLLAGIMLIASFTGCSDAGSGDEQQPDVAAEENVDNIEEDKAEGRTSIPDNLPAADFGGKSFRALVTETKKFQYVSDDLTGEVTNDVVYDRNIGIEDRFNCKIETVIDSAPYSTIDQYVKAGTNECEVVDHYEYKAYTPINKGDYLDWNQIPLIDQSQPWWIKAANDGSTINGKLFCIVGDLSITAMTFTFAIFYDIDLLSDYGYSSDDIYGLVFEGKWTLDKIRELSSQIYIDNNGNGATDAGDTLGYAYWNYHGTDVWVTAMGDKITEYKDGKINLLLGSEKTISALEKVIDLVYNTTGSFRFNDEPLGRSEFVAGRIGFMPLMFEDCYGELRDMENPYGVLPYPKYDEEQQEYYTNSMDQHSVFGTPINLPTDDYEFVGTLMEVLNAESYKTVFPAYYDIALKNKYSTDATTAQMIDLIMGGRVFEFSFQFGEYLSNLPYLFRYALYDNNPDFASTLKKVQKSINKTLEKVYACYE